MIRALWDFPLTWLLKPLIFCVFIPFYIYNWVGNLMFPKLRRYFEEDIEISSEQKRKTIEYLFEKSPVYLSESFNLYCQRTPYWEAVTGRNHNHDHQASRQGVWLSILAKSGVSIGDFFKAVNAHRRHWTGEEFSRGYSVRGEEVLEYNTYEVSGDMICGWMFGWQACRGMLDKECVEIGLHLLKNQGLTTGGKISPRANFALGFNKHTPFPVGAQELTHLVGIKAAMVSEANLNGKNTENYKKLRWEYIKRFYLYGSFLTIMIPSVGIPWYRRGYFNDNNCMMAGYVLCKNADNWFEKLIYQVSLFNMWSLSTPWLNGFFSGILYDALDGKLPTKKYMKRCLQYAIDCGQFDFSNCMVKKEKPGNWPIEPHLRENFEFLPEEGHGEITVRGNEPEFHSTIGALAMILWSDV